MKIIFIGCVKFSAILLEKLLSLNAEIITVITKSDSSINSDHEDLSTIASKFNIPYVQCDSVNATEIKEHIASLAPDIIFCFGWSELIRREVLRLPPLGVVGYHPAPLPKNRGRHPIIWTLALGMKRTASTFFFMDEGADDGDILSQIEVPVRYEDDASTLYSKLANVAQQQLETILVDLKNKSYSRFSQKNRDSNTWRKRFISDGKIDFRMHSLTIYNLVRALTVPYVGAHIEYKGEIVKVWKIEEEICDAKNIEPGKILSVYNDDTFSVKCGNGAVKIVQHDFLVPPKVGEYFL